MGKTLWASDEEMPRVAAGRKKEVDQKGEREKGNMR